MNLDTYNSLKHYIDLFVSGGLADITLDDQKLMATLDTNADELYRIIKKYIQVVDTIDDMLNLGYQDTSKIVIVTDTERGGLFKYKPEKKDINDGGLILNGYERVVSNRVLNVKWFGAKGDGIADDTEAINKAMHAGGRNSIIFFPKGDYFVSEKIEPYSNQTWQGEGSIDYSDLYYKVNKIEYADEGERLYWLYFPEISIQEIKKFIKGDQIFLSGFSNGLTNKPHEISAVDPDNLRMLIKHSYYDGDDYNETDVDGTGRIPYPVGGSAIRHRSLDGRLTIGKWFIHAEGVDYFCIRDLGFVGSGVNQSSGSEIKIVRNEEGAMEGFQWINVSWMDIPGNAIAIEAPINSRFEMIRAKKCAFDFFRILSINGSAMTSTVFKNIYVTSARRGFYIDVGVYNVMESIVIEGASIAIHGRVMNSNTFNSISTETVKYRKFRGGQGISFLIENGYGNVFNSPSVIYNSEPYEWIKGSFMFLGSTYGNLPTAVINGGRSHNSLNVSHQLLSQEQTSDTNTRIYYADETYTQLRSEYTKPGRFIAVHEKEYNKQDRNNVPRYRITNMYTPTKDTIQTDNTDYSDSRDPTADDDKDAGYNVGDTFENTDTSNVFLCVDNTNDNAVWKNMIDICAIEVYVDHKTSDSMITIDKRFTKVGRTVGSDIYTVPGFRVYQYEYDSANTKLYLWLDVYDRIPNLYLHKLHFDTDNKGYNGEMLCSYHELVDIDDTTYLDVVFKASRAIKDSTDFNWYNSETQQNDGTVYVSTDYDYIRVLAEDIICTKYRYDEETKLLHFIYTPTRFIKIGDEINVNNCLNPLLNGKYTISDVVGWDKITSLLKEPHAIKVEIDVDLGIDYDLTLSEEIGVYYIDRLNKPNTGQISMINTPMYRTTDPVNTITRGTMFTNQVTLPANQDSIVIQVPTPYDYSWYSYTPNIDITFQNETITLSRTDDSTDEKLITYVGVPYKDKLFAGTPNDEVQVQ